MQNQTKSYIFALITVVCWSTVSTAFKIALFFLSPLQLITLSMFMACIFLGIYSLFTGEFKKFKQYDKKTILLGTLPGIVLFIYYMLLFSAYDVLPAQIAQPINYSWALMLTLLSVWILKQKIDLKEFCWLIVAYSGVVVISWGGFNYLGYINKLGLFYVILSTFLYAVYWIGITKSKLSNTNQLWVSFLICSVLGIIVLAINGQFFALTKLTFFPALYIALFELSIPFIFWGLAIANSVSVARIATMPFLSPFLALIWVALILRENIAYTTYIGLSLIAFGTFMQQKKRMKS